MLRPAVNILTGHGCIPSVLGTVLTLQAYGLNRNAVWRRERVHSDEQIMRKAPSASLSTATDTAVDLRAGVLPRAISVRAQALNRLTRGSRCRRRRWRSMALTAKIPGAAPPTIGDAHDNSSGPKARRRKALQGRSIGVGIRPSGCAPRLGSGARAEVLGHFSRAPHSPRPQRTG